MTKIELCRGRFYWVRWQTKYEHREHGQVVHVKEGEWQGPCIVECVDENTFYFPGSDTPIGNYNVQALHVMEEVSPPDGFYYWRGQLLEYAK